MARQKTKYYTHDSNARNSHKIINLRMRHGAAGYGAFFMILERLRDEDDYKSIKDYNMIAFDLRVDASLVKSVVEDFGLFVFTQDGKYFYSESFCDRMEMMDDIKNKRSKAAEKRWNKTNDPKDKPAKGTEKPGKDVEAENLVTPHIRVQAAVAATEVQKKSVNSIPKSISGKDANQKCLEKFFNKDNQSYLETIMMQFHIAPKDLGDLKKLAHEVIAEWNIANTLHSSYNDWATHLISTMRIKRQDQRRKNRDGATPAPEMKAPSNYDYDGGFGGQDV